MRTPFVPSADRPPDDDRPDAVSTTGVGRVPTVPLRSQRPAADATDGEHDTPPPDPDRAERLIGRILAGRYEIKRVLGRGGMGIVYEAKHITLGRPVAIKILRHDLARSTEAVARFHREAKAAATIGSEHIVEVFDFGYTDEGDAFIAMELLEGEDLGRAIRREGVIAEVRALVIARQIARALEAAHAKGIIHRDLKSENVFLVQREGAEFVKLLDFGISKVSEGDEGRGPMTSEGVVMGTPHYMAPEQAMSGAEADHRIDVYALGCLLYEMLTGHVPFTGKNPVEVVFKHVHEAPVPPSKVRPEISAATEAIVLKALAKKREERFASASEALAALGMARDSMVQRGSSTSVPVARGRSSRGAIALVLVPAAVAAAWVYATAAPKTVLHPPQIHVVPPRPLPPVHDTPSVTTSQIVVVEPPHPIPVADTWLRITANPRTAVIHVDGSPGGTGTFASRFVRSSSHHVTVEADGYAPLATDVVLDRDVELPVRLSRLATGNAPIRNVADAASDRRTAGQEGHDAPRDAAENALDPAEGLKVSPYGGGR